MNVKKFLYLVFILVSIEMLFAACAAPASGLPPAATQAPVETQSPVEEQPSGGAAVPQETATPLPDTGAAVPEGWKTYENSTYHFTFVYPGEWSACGESEQSILLGKPMEEPGPRPLPSFCGEWISPQRHEGSQRIQEIFVTL